jgi:hypothetical protein
MPTALSGLLMERPEYAVPFPWLYGGLMTGYLRRRLAGNSGMPGDNVRANKQVGSICSALKLTKDQRRELHSAVSGQNLSYQEIKLLAIQMFCN